MDQAKYRHNCNTCRFLGHHEDGGQRFDLYHCLPDTMQLKKGEPKSPGLIVARFGNDLDAMLSLPITTLQQHEAEIQANKPEHRPLLVGLDRYLSSHHQIDDVKVRGWPCQIYSSPLGFVTIRTVDDNIELFVDCSSDLGAVVDAKALEIGARKAVSMMHERIETEMRRRRKRWNKR